ncbi:glutathione S-transferase family protein [Lonepinella sp. BR2919]|uniref:glutathione S-transferase family protein n=1 Tax=unclassified Lonepinella TaxID=2642006 RepID=UPI003F6E1A63
MKLKLHYLDRSRAMRVTWLLEHIGLPYELISHKRQENMHAPEALKDIHPLGKAPLLEIDGKVITESVAMVEWIIANHAPQLAPATNSPEYAEYLQWLQFSESTAMIPLVLKFIAAREPTPPQNTLAYADSEIEKVYDYVNRQLANKRYIMGDKLTGADFALAFALIFMKMVYQGKFANIDRYLTDLSQLPSWQKAQQIEQQVLQGK